MDLSAVGSAARSLAQEGVVAVAITFVDISGVTRVKAVPITRLDHAAEFGVGASPSFDASLIDDTLAMDAPFASPDGDLRLIPDLAAMRVLPSQPGWAWAPADRYFQNGTPYPACHRLLLADMVKRAASQNLRISTAIELEFTLFVETDSGYEPASGAPAYSMHQLSDLSDFATDLVIALDEAGVEVMQIHPESGHGQFEVSVAPTDPIRAADLSIVTRTIIRTTAALRELAVSFSPMTSVGGPGNGGHVHMSLWRDGSNQLSGGIGPLGMQDCGQAFAAGILEEIRALAAITNPVPVSYLRLRPSTWSGAFATWGLEAREAALRVIAAPDAEHAEFANVEIKTPDLAASPYLVLAGLIATGLAGIATRSTLPPPVQGDPARLSEQDREDRGIRRLPADLTEATDALLRSDVLAAALGIPLFDTIVAVRRAEQARSRHFDDEQIVEEARWVF